MGLIALVLIPVVLYYWAVGWFGFFGWIMAPLYFIRGNFIIGGLWLCAGIYGLQVYFGEGESYMGAYELVMGISLLAAFVQFCHKHRTAEAVTPIAETTSVVSAIVAAPTMDLVRNRHGVFTPRR